MIRILTYLLLLAAVAYGADWVLQRPGHIDVTWAGYHITTSAAVGFALIVLLAVVLTVVWSLLRFIFGLPSFVAMAARHRRRDKGYAALSRGLIAAGSGDARAASRASAQASKHLRDDPLALVLRAQAARLSGDNSRAEAAYGELAQREDTRILGLRGLHDSANRRGDDEAARHFAGEAYRDRALPWSAQTVLEHRAAEGDWQKALATVETSVAAKLVDRETGDRQRAVLETAIGLEKEAVASDEALALARSAMKRAPDLVPAIVLTARLLTRRGDIRKAAKLIESAWPRCPHPELARAYLDVRPGDSTSDRLARAQTLMRISSFDPISRMTVARTALAAKNFVAAREAMAPLIAQGQRPTVRACLLMADLEDAEFGDRGQWREWLARASRDPAWIADGIVYDKWEPVSPTTGRLDAFVWQAPADRPGHTMEAMPAPAQPRPVALAAQPEPQAFESGPPPAALEHHELDVAPVSMPEQAAPVAEEPPASRRQREENAWIAPAPVTSIAGTDGDNDAEAIIAVPAAPRRPFMRSVIVAPDDPGIDLPLQPSGKSSATQREDLTTTG
jgi:HemY protein